MIVAREVAAHSDMLCELREFLWGVVNLVKLAELVKLHTKNCVKSEPSEDDGTGWIRQTF